MKSAYVNASIRCRIHAAVLSLALLPANDILSDIPVIPVSKFYLFTKMHYSPIRWFAYKKYLETAPEYSCLLEKQNYR